jgi:LacI family transcriptional regulator, galactose operon repressor
VTSQDVADRAGVSRTTVSLVLNNVPGTQISDATRQRVLQAAKELNYVPEAAAQALASRQSQIVGLILIRTPDQIASDAFLTQTLDGLIKSIHKEDMRLLIDIIEPEYQEATYLRLMRAKRIDGILLSGPRYDDGALNALLENNFPTVLLGQLPGSWFYSVDVDNRAAAYTAVAHLLKLGHKQIACITNAPLSYTAAADRLAGYRQAIEDAGLPYDPALVRFGEFDSNSGYLQMISLLESSVEFTAAFIASDLVAYGAIAAIREHGLRIPEDVALVGMDDLPVSRFIDPPLTTVRLPAIELARQAAEILFHLLQGKKPEQKQVILDTNLVVRDSCGA